MELVPLQPPGGPPGPPPPPPRQPKWPTGPPPPPTSSELTICSFKYWQDGAPAGVPTLVSRLIDEAYWERQCALFFPPEDGFTYGIGEGRDVDEVNEATGGWTRVDNTTRLLWVNGEFDPWRDATVSSVFRPGGPLESTTRAPVYVIPGGIHCSDLIAANGMVNAGVQKVINEEVAVIKGWVESFYSERESGGKTDE